MTVFGLYSKYYDLLYGDKSYAGEAQYVLDLLGNPDAQMRLLEMGCGTGAHAAWLAERGHHVTGFDFSDDMLVRANRQKTGLADEVANRLDFQLGDVRTWRSGATYDAVISLFHVMSYQVSNADLEAAFATAASHLQPGGLFVFDYWFGPAVLNLKPSVRVKRLQTEDVSITRIAEPEHIPSQNTVIVNYDVRIEDSASRHEGVKESHHMRYLFLPEIEYMSARWFKPVAHHAWMERRAPNETDWAGISILERKA